MDILLPAMATQQPVVVTRRDDSFVEDDDVADDDVKAKSSLADKIGTCAGLLESSVSKKKFGFFRDLGPILQNFFAVPNRNPNRQCNFRQTRIARKVGLHVRQILLMKVIYL